MAFHITPLYGLVAITFLNWTAFSSTYVAVPLMVLQDKCAELGLSGDDCDESNEAQSRQASFMALFTFATNLTAVVSCTFISHLSDIVGRKPLLLSSAIRAIIVYIFLSQAGAGMMAVVVLGAMNFLGDTFVANGVVFACGTDPTAGHSEVERALVLGRLESALWAGQVAGPLISGQLIHTIGPKHVFYFPAALSVVSLIITLLLPETLCKDRRVRFSFQKAHPFAVLPILYRHPRSLIFALGLFFLQLGLISGVATWPMFCTHFFDMSSGGIGAVMATFFGCNALGLFLLTPILTRTLSPRCIILLACAASIFLWGLHFALHDVWQLFATALLGLFSNLFFPMVRSGIATDLGPRMYGGASGIIALVQDLVMVGSGPAANTTWKYIQANNLPDPIAYVTISLYCTVAFFIFRLLPSAHNESKTQKEYDNMLLGESQGSADT